MTILATNDIHAHLDEFNKGGTDCRQKDIDANLCFGGAARIKYLVDKTRAENDNVVLLDAGDQFQGTLFFNVFGGTVSGQIMNMLKYDAMCIGNHEFDNGIEYAAEFFKNLTFPVVSSNIDLETAKPLKEAGVKPYTILKDYGVGIIGYITNTTASIATGAQNVTFYNAAPVVQKYVDELHAMGIKRIICVSHNGYNHDKYLAENTRGVNLIVGGHSHSLLLDNTTIAGVVGPYPTAQTNLDGQPTYIVQSHRYGDYLGHVQLAWNDADELLSVTGESILMDKSVPKHNETAIQVAEWRKEFAALTALVVGKTSGVFDIVGCGTGECAIGNLIADSMQADAKTDIAFHNAGGIRAAFQIGDVTYADVLTCLPFGNTVTEFTYTGQQVLDLLERVYAGKSKDGNVVVSKPQWAGIKFSYNPALPEFQRIVKVEIGGRPLDPAATYSLATNDFVSGGGDGIMDKLSLPPGNLMADALINWFKLKGTVAPTIEGRITVVSA
ncbi:hypothetical protein PhCBS80983_g04420 [Powellomyces hirtus]|uniref:5'-nucleotidase n=1 Tax=Powellomyces hirtus TaxID=109895 RepID=A0A507DXV9_9FUNG|nr:hypothetical protein PhCBS80983_g04420 [Powellomyces hirtus]